jgi:FkbM family methyltransferase
MVESARSASAKPAAASDSELHLTVADLEDALGKDFITERIAALLRRKAKGNRSEIIDVLRKARGLWSRASRARSWEGVAGKWTLFEHPEGFLIRVKLGDSVSVAILRGNYDRATSDAVLAHLSPGGTFIDIGANVGWFTLLAAKFYRDRGGRVFSFEPQAEIFRNLTRSVSANGFESIATVHCVALGDRNGEIQMIDAGSNSGGSSIVAPELGRPEFETVQIRRFDDVVPALKRVDIVKMDIEGAEPLFFKGATEFVGAHRPLIVSEVAVRKLKSVSGTDAPGYIQSVVNLGYQARKLTSRGELVALNPDELADDRTVIQVMFEPV